MASPRLPIRLFVALLAAGSCFAFVGSAQAGYVIQPASGTTIESTDPSFLVYLDSNDSLATVYVASSPAMTSYGSPVDRLGSCTPTTPFGELNKYTCRVGYYLGASGGRLSPGTYYWWMSYWQRDADHPYGTQQISGPFVFTVVQPQAPTDVALISPFDGATVVSPFRVQARIPAGAHIRFYAASDAARQNDGSPVGLTLGSCEGDATVADTYYCDINSYLAIPGETYYWWVIVETDGAGWVYGPRSVTIKDTSGSGGSGGSAGGGSVSGGSSSRTYSSAATLRKSNTYRGTSVKDTKITAMVYATLRLVAPPKTLAVACWSPADWLSVTESANVAPESGSSTLTGLHLTYQPRWLHLAPSICTQIQQLIDTRVATGRRAYGLGTALHEAVHAYGIRNEAQTSCYSVQLIPIAAHFLGFSNARAGYLGKLGLQYTRKVAPPGYWNSSLCRDGGAWDLYKTITNLT